jgi:hypothetical protein
MSATDILAIVGAVTFSITSIIAAVGTVIVAVRTGRIQQGTDKNHEILNSQHTAMLEIAEKQRTALQEAGITLPLDDSLNRKET